MNSVTPAAGASASRFVDPARDPLAFEGEHHPFEDPLAGHPLTAPARPRTK